MKPLFLQPHSDDGVLFACYTLLAEKPHVITCYAGGAHRTEEDAKAFEVLGVDWYREWPQPERKGDQEAMEAWLSAWLDVYPHVYAPAYEDGGHQEHNAVALAALNTFGPTRTRGYMTYRRGHGRSRSDNEVVPRKEWWVSRKLWAMACYTSQIEQASTRPWFSDWDREWLA